MPVDHPTAQEHAARIPASSATGELVPGKMRRSEMRDPGKVAVDTTETTFGRSIKRARRAGGRLLVHALMRESRGGPKTSCSFSRAGSGFAPKTPDALGQGKAKDKNYARLAEPLWVWSRDRRRSRKLLMPLATLSAGRSVTKTIP